MVISRSSVGFIRHILTTSLLKILTDIKLVRGAIQVVDCWHRPVV